MKLGSRKTTRAQGPPCRSTDEGIAATDAATAFLRIAPTERYDAHARLALACDRPVKSDRTPPRSEGRAGRSPFCGTRKSCGLGLRTDSGHQRLAASEEVANELTYLIVSCASDVGRENRLRLVSRPCRRAAHADGRRPEALGDIAVEAAAAVASAGEHPRKPIKDDFNHERVRAVDDGHKKYGCVLWAAQVWAMGQFGPHLAAQGEYWPTLRR